MKKYHIPFILFVTLLALPFIIYTALQQQDTRSKAQTATRTITVKPIGGNHTTIQAAANAAQPGDTIMIDGGTYNEQLNITKSGSAGNYITFQNNPGEKVIVTGGTLKVTGNSYVKIIGITVKGSSSFGAYADRTNNVVFKDFEIDTSQDGGLVILASTNILVDGCNIHGTNSRGTSANHEALSIGEGSSNFEIKNCNVHDNGEEGIDAKYNPNANGSIHDNIVSNNRGPNIYVDSSVGVKVYNNISYGTKEGSKAGIAIAAETAYTGTNNPRKASNIDIYNNISYGNAGGGINFYTEPGGTISDVRVYNNTIVNNSKSAIVMATSALSGNNLVFNNIFSGNSVGGGNGLTMGTNFTTDAKFVSATDYHLQAGSPAIDKGTAAGAPAFDKDNKTRPAGGGVDMGAYEFGATGGTAPTINPATTMPEPTNIAPSFVCLTNEPCTTPVPTQQARATPPGGNTNPGTPPVGGTNPNPGNPGTNPEINPQPCLTNGTAGVFHNKKKVKSGGGFIEQFIKFILRFIELFFKLLGISLPNPGQNPQPNPGQEPCPEPTIETEPTDAPEPTVEPTIDDAQPTTIQSPTQSPTSSGNAQFPGQILNLSNWKLQLPIGKVESPTEIKQPTFATYQIDPWFIPLPDGGVRFRAAVNGVTTSGSEYPRSELREMSNNGTANAAWSTTSGTHTMFLDQAITAVPTTKKHVVAGQVHDGSKDVIVIRLEQPKLFINIGGTEGPVLDANYTLGKRFTVKFESSGGQIKIYYNGSTTPAHTYSKNVSTAYFKAGAYTQSNCTRELSNLCNLNNYGEVVIYKVEVTHQ